MPCLVYPYASGENGKGGCKVVFGVLYSMINELILNGNYLVCRGCATGSGQDETRESDVKRSLLPSSSNNTEVKFSYYNLVWNLM